VMQEQLGENHPFTLSCQVNKANCLHDLGRLAEAEILQRETADGMRKALRSNHPDTFICEANLAVILRAQGRSEEAEALRDRVIRGLRQVLGIEHPNVLALRDWRLQNRDLEAQPT
jgi:Tetratricopeptide repeat